MPRKAFSCLMMVMLAAHGQNLWAETVRFKDGTVLKADILEVEDDEVTLSVLRDTIETVSGQPLPPALKEGVAAPAFTAADLAGKPHTVGSGKAKVTLLHFWVQWCPHCRSDAPQIQALYEAYKDNPDVRILAINLDKKREKVDAFVKDRQVGYPVIMAADQKAAGSDLTRLYQITGFPITFLIDGQGIIRYKKRGSFAEGKVDLKAVIDRMLSG